MVSLWPWKGEASSPAAFERALSTLSDKIARSTTHLDRLRQRSRRLKALWTLYSTFAYIVYLSILILVIGWKNGGPIEYSAAASSPLLIYLVRLAFTSYYNYRINNVTARLDDLQKERDATIEKLKTATKYNSTQELLEKYGGSTLGSTAGSNRRKSKTSTQSLQSTAPKHMPLPPQHRRTGIPPPATANIPRNENLQMAPLPSKPQQTPLRSSSRLSLDSPSQQLLLQPTEDFAPNAFPTYSSAPLSGDATEASHWYDRVLDLLMGEDETAPRNRIALICQKCRLVNGQAAPGIKSLEEVGKWRCGGCGFMNGEDKGKDEVERIIGEVKEEIELSQDSKLETKASETSEEDDDAVFVSEDQDVSEEGEGIREQSPPKPKKARSKKSGSRKP